MPRTLKPIRWTIERAAAEFGLDRKTLSGRIHNRGIVPADDGKFSTRDICVAIFTDGKAARDKLAEAQEENFVLRNKKLAGELADVALFQQISDSMILVLRQKISDARITQELKNEILRDIQNIDVHEVVKANPKTDDTDLGDES